MLLLLDHNKLNRKLRIITVWFLLFFIIRIPQTTAQDKLDFDADGVSDPVIINSTFAGDSLEWSFQSSSKKTTVALNSFGSVSDLAVPGRWTQTTQAEQAVVSKLASGALEWKVYSVNQQEKTVEFGQGNGYVVAGADLNNNGYQDAIFISFGRTKQRSLEWHIALDLFSTFPAEPFAIRLGTNQDIPFFFNPDGLGDCIGVVHIENKISPDVIASTPSVIATCQNVVNSTQRVFSLPPLGGKTATLLPLPQENGLDNLLIVRRSQYIVVDSNGVEIIKGRLRTQGAAIVGNFVKDVPGFELALRSGRTNAVPVLNPLLRQATTFTLPGGAIFDDTMIQPVGNYSLPPFFSETANCSRFEKSGAKGKEFQLITDADQNIAVEARRMYTSIVVEVDSKKSYQLSYIKSNGKNGGLWSSRKPPLSTLIKKGLLVATINEQRSCWQFDGTF
jgi:hypothetical protein